MQRADADPAPPPLSGIVWFRVPGVRVYHRRADCQGANVRTEGAPPRGYDPCRLCAPLGLSRALSGRPRRGAPPSHAFLLALVGTPPDCCALAVRRGDDLWPLGGAIPFDARYSLALSRDAFVRGVRAQLPAVPEAAEVTQALAWDADLYARIDVAVPAGDVLAVWVRRCGGELVAHLLRKSRTLVLVPLPHRRERARETTTLIQLLYDLHSERTPVVR